MHSRCPLPIPQVQVLPARLEGYIPGLDGGGIGATSRPTATGISRAISNAAVSVSIVKKKSKRKQLERPCRCQRSADDVCCRAKRKAQAERFTMRLREFLFSRRREELVDPELVRDLEVLDV